MTSESGLRVARVAKFYGDRPSSLMTRSLSEYEAYCVDEALMVRVRVLEASENRERVEAPPLAGGHFLPGPVIA